MPEAAYEKAFYVKGTCAGMAVSWMEHKAWQRGVHIHHSMCGHGGEMVIAGYPEDGFCPEAKTVFQFHSCHWHGCPECLVWFQDLEEIGDVCKMETQKRQVDITGPSRWGLRLQDGQAQGVRFYYSLSGQVPPQV